MDKVVVDTGFLSTLLKGDLVDKAVDVLEVDSLIITLDVKKELDYGDILNYHDTEKITIIEYQVVDMENKSFGIGEISCIKYCKENECGLLIDDRKARDWAEENNIPTLTIPDLLYLGKRKNKIKNEEMRKIIERMRKTDKYIFKKEVEEVLLG